MTMLEFWIPDTTIHQPIPFVLEKISAGFPIEADGFIEASYDINEILIRNPSATFYARAKGNGLMATAGIGDGDILVVDKSVEPATNKLAICVLYQQFTIRRLRVVNGEVFLVSDVNDHPPISVDPYAEPSPLWGIITFVVKKV